MQFADIQVVVVYGAVDQITDRSKMSIMWKYKIDIKDMTVFDEIEEMRNIVFPEDLKKFVIKTNAATPSDYKFMLGNSERVFGAVLSFNRDDRDVDLVFTALNVISDNNLLPFAIDSFGNYMCYSIQNKTIVFWNHENGSIEYVAASLDKFIGLLY